jgi:O-antigen/teichoic acid export membrane protein
LVVLKRKFITNLALLLSLNLVIKPLYAFGIDVGVQNAVGARNYGSYFILLSFSLIFQILLDLGIESYTRREIARNSHLLSKYFSNIFPLKLILGGLYFAFCALIGYFLDWHAYEYKLLLLLLFNQFLANFILYLRANLGGLHMFRADSIISVIDRFIVILICGILLLNPVTHHAFRIEWLVYSQTVSYLITAVISFGIVFSKCDAFSFKFDMRYYITFLRQSLPYALLTLLMATYLRIDSILLGKLLINGKEEAGIYVQSFRIVEILSNYGYLFTIILLPVFSRMIKQRESVAQITGLSFALMFVPAIIVTFGCLSYNHEIINLLYNEHVQQSARVFRILIFSFLGMCITYIFGTLLTANGNIMQLNMMALIAVIINLVLNMLLIKKFGVFGAAIANMTTQLFTSVYQIFLVKRIFKFETDYLLLWRLITFTIITALSSFLFNEIPVNWVYSFGFYLIFGVILSLITRLINLKSIFQLIVSIRPS